MNWIESELSGMQLGDRRLEKRAVNLFEKLSSNPTESIPGACNKFSETKAAYRFFDHKNVSAEKILAPHINSTISRIQSHKTVLLLQDTTELSYRGQPEKSGVGPSKYDDDQTLFLHPLIAVTPDKCPLGIVDNLSWYREELHTRTKTKQELNSYHMHCPIEFKESYRWLLGYQKSCKIAERCPDTQIICVGDRESDIFDIYHNEEQRGDTLRADWLVRARINRVLLDENDDRKTTLLFEEMKKTKEVGKIKITVPKRGNQKKRTVILSVKIKQVKLHPPTGRRGQLKLEPVHATVVATSEINPPKGCAPIEWILLTSVLCDDTLSDAKKIMAWYLARWQIEVFFKTLKTGCRVEAIQIKEGSRFLPCIAMYLIITWRIMYITHLSRTEPTLDCNCCYSKDEWRTIYMLNKKRKPPKVSPSIEVITRMLATMGGYLGRKSDGPPGPKTIWLGLRVLNNFLQSQNTLKKVKEM